MANNQKYSDELRGRRRGKDGLYGLGGDAGSGTRPGIEFASHRRSFGATTGTVGGHGYIPHASGGFRGAFGWNFFLAEKGRTTGSGKEFGSQNPEGRIRKTDGKQRMGGRLAAGGRKLRLFCCSFCWSAEQDRTQPRGLRSDGGWRSGTIAAIGWTSKSTRGWRSPAGRLDQLGQDDRATSADGALKAIWDVLAAGSFCRTAERPTPDLTSSYGRASWARCSGRSC